MTSAPMTVSSTGSSSATSHVASPLLTLLAREVESEKERIEGKIQDQYNFLWKPIQGRCRGYADLWGGDAYGPPSRGPGHRMVPFPHPQLEMQVHDPPIQATHEASFPLQFARLVGTRITCCVTPFVCIAQNRQLRGDRTWTHGCRREAGRRERCLMGPESLSGVMECSGIRQW